MKKRIIIVCVSIVIVFTIIVNMANSGENTNKVYTEINGVKYAILVNGTTALSFPSGNYKATINCTNATGYWNQVEQQVIIKNITGDPTCDISFTSISSSDYLNNYLISLAGTNQGTGKMLHDVYSVIDDSNTTTVKTFTSTPIYFESSWPSAIKTAGSTAYWTYDSNTGTFTSNTSLMTTNGDFYHAYFQLPEEGDYQICFTMAQSSSINHGFIVYSYKDSSETLLHVHSYKAVDRCSKLGHLAANTYLNISEYKKDTSSVPQMTFRIEKILGGSPVSFDTGYRYEGKNPNNYVLFNNELWRIIGVFDETSHGQIGKNLVKLIRNEPIGGYVWIVDDEHVSGWQNSNIYALLNGAYYNHTVGTNCYTNDESTTTCDFKTIGIQSNYQNMIKNVTWYLGGPGQDYADINYTPANFYLYERDPDSVFYNQSLTITGNVGLVYASDYYHAVLASDCSRTTILFDYDSSSCDDNNWLYGFNYEWTMTEDSGPGNYSTNRRISCTYILGDPGWAGNWYTSNSNNVRPVVYLSDSVYRVSGTGSMSDPYVLGMATTN